MVVNEERQDVIARVLQLRDETLMGYRAIAAVMDKEYPRLDGKKWHPFSVSFAYKQGKRAATDATVQCT